MGWFLTRKKRPRKGQRKSVKADNAATPRWSLERTARLVRVMAMLALVLGLTGGWYLGEQALRGYVADRHIEPLTAADIELHDAPAWMTQAVRDRLQDFVADHVEPAPLDPVSLRAAAEALAHDPWVREVRQVRRRADGRIEVDAAYREPVAVIQGRDGYHLVDADAVRLPGLYLRHQIDALVEQTGIALITGVASAPPARPGQAWPGSDVRAALDLVRLLDGEPYLEQIRRFDVASRDARGRLHLTLHTDAGLVRWGLPPGQERAIEPDADVKRRWLAQLYDARGDIDAGGRIVHLYGATIKVSDPATSPASSEPAGAAQGSSAGVYGR
ncbi:MAG: hypothetical protein WD009_12925 [Phycisphaeraceae bacterium]